MHDSIDTTILERILTCGRCGGAVSCAEGACTCASCGHVRRFSDDGVLLDPDLVGKFDPSDLTYDSQTKHRYQSESYADGYQRRYRRALRAGGSPYAALIANRERAAVRRALIAADPAAEVLDLPAGTGKLAEIHAEFGHAVVAADVSVEMLRAGLADEWRSFSSPLALLQADATSTHLRDDSVEIVICLRLLHRLPVEILDAVLVELARVSSRWLIVSNGVDRHSLAGRFGRGPEPGQAGLDSTAWREHLLPHGDIVREFPILRGVSKEVVTLLRVG